MASNAPIRRRSRSSISPGPVSNQFLPCNSAEKCKIADEDLRQLIEIAPEGVSIQQERRIVYVNQAAAEQYGANDPREILGRDVYHLIAPVDRERILARIKQLYDEGVGGQSHLTRFQRLCLDGRVVDVETVAITILWGGRPAILSLVRDVTARLEAEDRVRSLLSTGTHWLWETDAEHRFTFVSEGPNKLSGFHENILGKTRWELDNVPRDDAFWRSHKAHLNAREPFDNFQYWNRLPCGVEICASISGTPIFDASGTFKGYRGIASDITERIRAEQVMRESEERFKLALEGASGGVFDIDLVSGEVTYDQQSARMLGYDRADEVPRQLTDWMKRLHPDDRAAARTRLDEMLEGKTEILRSEQRQRNKSGKWLWFNCIGKVVERGDDGRPTRLVGLRFDITERKQAELMIEHMALHDALTKLPNRVYFNDELERACRAARRNGTKLAVLFLDLDHFKDINDTLGHSVGDKLLIDVANRLKSCLRGGDLVARFGGDEFVMVVTQSCDPAMIRYLADRMTKKVAEPYDIDGLTVHTGISIGIAIYPDDGSDTERILANADLALYTAKRAGRHTWRVFNPSLQRQLQAQRSLDQELRHAFDRQQFELHYQPLINIADDRTTGFEALIRWNHPKHGQMQPDRFIPATEQNRLIIPLTEWVLQEAAMQLRRWESRGLGQNKIAVNVSPSLLKLQGFVDLVDRCLDVTDCDPRHITIEITEEALVDEAKVICSLIALRERGVSIAIDDFGMGYSSMARLKTLPVDILKIDRSFLANVTRQASDASIVESLVSVGHSLGKTVVAEGVETVEQLDFLRGVGCDTAQGFFINRPMPAADIPFWFEQWQSSRLCAADVNIVGSN